MKLMVKGSLRKRWAHVRYRNLKNLVGTAERPRLSIYKSNKALYAQIIDDGAGKTLAAIDTRKLSGKNEKGVVEAGQLLAKKALDLGIKSIVFDRSGYRYFGRVKAFSAAIREAGVHH